MANPEHVKVIKKGVKAWNEWRKDNMGARPDLSGIKLTGRELPYANFMVTDLSGCDLSGATSSRHT